jgi:hypothetical protein
MPRLLKIVLLALLIGGVLASALAYCGKRNFDESEYGYVR